MCSPLRAQACIWRNQSPPTPRRTATSRKAGALRKGKEQERISCSFPSAGTVCSSRLGARGDKLLSRGVYNPSRQRGPGGNLLGSHCSNLTGQQGAQKRGGLPTHTSPTDNAQGAITLGSSYVWKKGMLAVPEAQHCCVLRQKEQKHNYSVGVVKWFQHGVGKC